MLRFTREELEDCVLPPRVVHHQSVGPGPPGAGVLGDLEGLVAGGEPGAVLAVAAEQEDEAAVLPAQTLLRGRRPVPAGVQLPPLAPLHIWTGDSEGWWCGEGADLASTAGWRCPPARSRACPPSPRPRTRTACPRCSPRWPRPPWAPAPGPPSPAPPSRGSRGRR